MKRCPECRRDYFDDSLLYCLDDGSALLEGPASGDESLTKALHQSDLRGEAVTRIQNPETHSSVSPPSTAERLARGNTHRKTIMAVGVIVCTLIVGVVGY